jgi:hypothetical protein
MTADTNKNKVKVTLESTKLILKYLPTFFLYKSNVISEYRKNIDLDVNLKKSIKDNKLSYEQFLHAQINQSAYDGFDIHFDVINKEDDKFKFNFVNKATQKKALYPYEVRKSIIIQNDKTKAREFSIKNIEKQLFDVDFHNIDFSKINNDLGDLSEKFINMVDFKLEVVNIDLLSELHKGNLGSSARDVYRSINDLSHLNNVSNDMLEKDKNMLKNALKLKRITTIPLFTNFDNNSSIKFNFYTDAKFELKDNIVKLKDTTLAFNYEISTTEFQKTLNVFRHEPSNVLKEALYSPNKGSVRFTLVYDLFDVKSNAKYHEIPSEVFDIEHYHYKNNNYKTEGYQLLLAHPEVKLEGIASTEGVPVKVKDIDFDNSKIAAPNDSWYNNIPTTKISRYKKTVSFEIDKIVNKLFKLNIEENYTEINTFSGVSDYVHYKIDTFYNHLNKSKNEEVKIDVMKRMFEVRKRAGIKPANNLIQKSYPTYSKSIGKNIFESLSASGLDVSLKQKNSSLEFETKKAIKKKGEETSKTINVAAATEALGNYKTFLYISKNNNVTASDVGSDSDALWDELSTDMQRTNFSNEGISFGDFIKDAKAEIENVRLIDNFAVLNNVSEDHPLGKVNLINDPHISYPNGSFSIVKSHRRGNVQPRLLMLIRKATIALKRKFNNKIEKVIINSRSSMDIPTWVQIATINATEYSTNKKANKIKKIEEIKKIIPGLGIEEKNYNKFINILAGRYRNKLDNNHSGGYGVDIKIKLKTTGAQKFMCLWKPNTDKDFEIAAYFSKVCKMLGANGIGAAVFYADYPEPVVYKSKRPPLNLKPGLTQYEGHFITENSTYIRKKNTQNWNEIHIDILKDNETLLNYLENNSDNFKNEIFDKFSLKTKKAKQNLASNLRGWGQDFTSNSIETWLSNAIGVRNRKLNKNKNSKFISTTFDRSFDISGESDLTHSGNAKDQMKKYASVEISVAREAVAPKKNN